MATGNSTTLVGSSPPSIWTTDLVWHTPYRGHEVLYVHDGAEVVCQVWLALGEGDRFQREKVTAKRATLIAAAPALLKSLESMVDMFERHLNNVLGPDDAAQRWDAARDAIKAAKGGAS